MTERIGEATLMVNPPRSVVILDTITGNCCSSGDGPLNEGVRILSKDFNTDRGLTNDRRTGKTFIGGFVKKEWCSTDFQTSHGAKAPQLLSSKCGDVPLGSGRRILNSEH